MVTEMKFVIAVSDKILHTLTKEIRADEVVNCLQEFQKDVNSLLTKMIEEIPDTGNHAVLEDEYYSNNSSDNDEQHPGSPKKTRK